VNQGGTHVKTILRNEAVAENDEVPTIEEFKMYPIKIQPMNCGWAMPFVFKSQMEPTESRIHEHASEFPLAKDGQGHSLIPHIRTLLVDDSPLMLKILEQILAAESKFAVVGYATNGYQALAHTKILVPDLVLMDFDLPLLNGAQATTYIKHFRNPPVVFMVTSSDSSVFQSTCEAAGVDAFFAKSDDLHAELKAKLQEWFG
jgi:CheY-like chemotaxis protein